MVGLKGSGKTSFVAALWHQLEAAEVATDLVAATLQPDRTYLNKIRDAWLQFNDVPRTSLQVQESIALHLRRQNDGDQVDLEFPDLSGESYRFQWAKRRATSDYANRAQRANGLLLFVHPLTIRLPARIPARPTEERSPSEVPTTENAARDSAHGGTGAAVAATNPASQETEWKPEHAATQVPLVDLLQYVLGLRTPADTLPISVVISAWDTVRDAITPGTWLERRLPLLWQFLLGNPSRLAFRVFGISALGGDLKKDKDRLAAFTRPAERVRVVESDGTAHTDLTRPILFLIDPETGTPA